MLTELMQDLKARGVTGWAYRRALEQYRANWQAREAQEAVQEARQRAQRAQELARRQAEEAARIPPLTDEQMLKYTDDPLSARIRARLSEFKIPE